MEKFVKRRVSVVIPAHNSEGTIERCLLSIENQTYSDVEIIFVNNNSSDETSLLAKSILKKSKFRVVSLDEPQQGVAFARNKALSYASGQYICFLDSDDELYADSISRRVNCIFQTSVPICYGNYDIVYEDGRIKTMQMPAQVTAFNKYYANWIPNLCGMYDRSMLEIVFQKNVGHEDYEMWLQLLDSTEKAVNVGGKPLSRYYQSKMGLSGNKLESAKWHYNVLKRQSFGLKRRIWYFSFYVLFQIYKRLR